VLRRLESYIEVPDAEDDSRKARPRQAARKAVSGFQSLKFDPGVFKAIEGFQSLKFDPGVFKAIENFQSLKFDPGVFKAIENFQSLKFDPGVIKAIENFQSLKFDPGVIKAIQQLLQPDLGLLRIIEQAGVATRDWNRILRGMAAQKQLEREVLPQLAVHGWLISPSGPASQPTMLHKLFQEGGIAAVDRYLMDLLDADACRAIVEHAAKPKTPFARWGRTFEKASSAMERGDHELAIPIWLAALESACLRTFKLKRVYSAQADTTRQRIAIQWARLSDGYEPLARAWVDVLIGVSGPPRGPVVLNRHAIMHGQRPLIGSRKDALQCLLAIEVFGYLWAAISEQRRTRDKARAGS
jgi:hypothetical protein